MTESNKMILLVEDEPHIAQGIIFNLEAEGYQVTHLETGEEALEYLDLHPCSLLVLDLMLPGIDGLEVCRQIRQHQNQLPILMLTARGEEKDRVAGLREGADDYLTKPFSLKEFLLRVEGMLRRSNWYQEEPSIGKTMAFGNNLVDLENRTAVSRAGAFELTELEVRMLEIFFRQEGSTLSRGQLLQTVWGLSPETETRTLDNFIVRLRKYFEEDPTNPKHFLTVRGRGYRFLKTPEK